MSARRGRLSWAILVGINDYYNTGRNLSTLRGCTHDVDDVAEVLERHLGEINTTRITSSGDPSLSYPTRDAVVKSIEDVEANSQDGDFIYVHFSGHGAQQRASKKAKQSTGRDIYEVLMLDDKRHLKDYEFGKMLDRLADKGRIVFVVLDCCHSGGADRSSGGPVRGIDDVLPADEDESVPDAVGDPSVEDAPCRDGSTRQCFWLQARKYTVLAACQPSQKARETSRASRHNGLLTSLMIQSLAKLSTPGNLPTYTQLHQDILASMLAKNPSQSCMLLGEKDRTVFGESVAPSPYAGVVANLLESEVEINLGEVHGVRVGEVYDVYERGAVLGDNEGGETASVAVLTITSVKPLHSLAGMPTPHNDQVQRGSPVRLRTPVLEAPLRVRIHSPELYEGLVEQLARRPIRPGVELRRNGETDCTYQVLSTPNGYELADATGQPLQNLARIPVNVNSAHEVCNSLQRIARYWFLADLSNKNSHLDQSFGFRVVNGGGQPEVFHGEKVNLELENLTAGPGARPLYFHLFDLNPTWAVELQAPGLEIQPEKRTMRATLTMSLPPETEEDEVRDIYVLIVTTKSVQLQGLADGDQRSDSEDNIEEALDDLQAVSGGGSWPSSRNGNLTLDDDDQPPDDWQAAKIVITTRRRL